MPTDALPSHPPRPAILSLILLTATISVAAIGCHGAAQPAPEAGRAIDAQQQQLNDEVRKELDLIPPPSKTRYMAVRSLTSWENPYITVQDGMVTLHVTVADANTSSLGQGGMLRPVGARRQELNIRVGEIPAALNAVPQSAWPYGRVVAIEEAHEAPASVRPQLRRNMENVVRTLSDLGVVVYEWSDGGPGLR